MKGKILICGLVTILGFSGATAQETGVVDEAQLDSRGAVIVDGLWYEFAFTSPGAPTTGCSPADPAGPPCTPSSGGNSVFADAPPWTFTGPARLTVTDAFNYGDSFEVLDFGVPIGFTPPVAGGPGGCGSDPVPCVADPLTSTRVFDLGAGGHSITITPIVAVFNMGAAYFRVDSLQDIGGTMTGAQVGLFAICQNQTTGQTVTIPLVPFFPNGQAWSCTDAGLVVNPGDIIIQLPVSVAQ